MYHTHRIAAGAGVAALISVLVVPLGAGADDISNAAGQTSPSIGSTPSATASPNSLLQMEIQKSAVSPSGARKSLPSKTTLKSATPLPKTSPSAVRSAPKTSSIVTTIRSYRDCRGFAQSCINQGYLTWYYPGAPTLAGHNYMGYQWLSRLPIGRTVKVTSGPLKGTYRVYDHAWSKRAKAGGKFPAKAERAALVLQTCEPNGTGYSLLRRV